MTKPTTNHLFIAGMGRAGTSFLVRYLTALGLDTLLSRKGEDSGWDANANAGLEQTPVDDMYGPDRPYVIKSPWLHEYIQELVKDGATKIDAVIMPVRDLTETAASRLILERRAMYQSHLWMAETETVWDSWGGSTPGGGLYSLNMIDEGRIIAAGFYKLVEVLAKHHIPMIFIHFPTFAQEEDYLFNALKPVLPGTITAEGARAAFLQTAGKDQVRVGDELGQIEGNAVPGGSEIDRIAMRREILRLQKELYRVQSALNPFQRGKLGWLNRKALRLSLWARKTR